MLAPVVGVVLTVGAVVGMVFVPGAARAQELTETASSAPQQSPPPVESSPVESSPEVSSPSSGETPGEGQKPLTADWAAERTNLGNALQEQARRIEGDASRQLFAQSVVAYRGALQVFTEEEHPRLWAATLNNLGTALEALGSITQGEAGDKLLKSAAQSHRSALKVFIRDVTPQDWAMTHDHLGATLYTMALRAESMTRPLLLHEALTAHRLALEVLTPDASPEPWSLARLNEALTLRAARKPIEAADVLRESLAQYPDSRESTLQLIELLHDELFDYRGALQTASSWLQRFPDDTFIAVRSIEPLFALGRAEETTFLARHLQTQAGRSGDLQGILRTYEAASLLARKQLDEAAVALAALRQVIEARPDGWQPLWLHTGTRHYLLRADLAHQPMITRLFEVVEIPERRLALNALNGIAGQL